MPVPAKTTRSTSGAQPKPTRNRVVSTKAAKPAAVAATASQPGEVDALANRMAGSLRIKDGASSSTAKAVKAPSTSTRVPTMRAKAAAENVSPVLGKEKEELAPAERGRQAMRAVNAAVQILTGAVQAGWKVSQARAKAAPSIKPRSVNKDDSAGDAAHSVESVTSTTSKCRAALTTLRSLKGQIEIKPIDVERAAVNVAGKLVSLEMWNLALEVLHDSRPSALALYEHDTLPGTASSVSTKTASVHAKSTTRQRSTASRSAEAGRDGLAPKFALLRFPLPRDNDNADGTVLNVIASSQLYALTSCIHLVDASSISDLHVALSSTGNLLDFIPVFQSRLGSKFYSTLALSTFRSIATNLSSSDAHPADALFAIRTWALRCLIRADSVSGNDFWDQSMRWAASHLKAVPAGSKDQEKVAADHVMTLFTELVNCASDRPDGRDFANGAAFGKLCDWWITLARRCGNLETINAVSNLLASTSTASTDMTASLSKDPLMTPARRRTKKEDLAMSLSKVFARISHAEAVAHKLVTDGEDNGVAGHLEDVLSDIRQLPKLYRSVAEGAQRLQRETERLRHSCVKVLDKTNDASQPCQALRPACVGVLEALVDVAQGILSSDENDTAHVQLTADFYADLTSGALDSLLALSRSVLSPAQHATHQPAYSYLDRATKLSRKAPEKDAIKYLRCIAAAYQNAAALMYKHNKAEYAIRFAEQAYLLGVDAFDTTGIEDAERSSTRDHLGRRAEMLANCYLKKGDRKLAYKAYCNALTWLPLDKVETIRSALESQGVQATFAAHSSLSALVDRITRLAVSDLFLPPSESSLRMQLEGRGMPSAVVGGLLELQVLSMDAMLHKPECLTAVSGILEDLLGIYSQELFPIRRARALLRKLEHQYYTAPGAAESVASDVLGGFIGDDKGNDTGLIAFIPQYQALTHVWLAMQSHANVNGPSMPGVLQHTNETVRILRQAFVRGTAEDSPISVPSPKNQKTGKGQVKPRYPQTPKTPKARRAVSGKTPKPLSSVGHETGTSTVTRDAAANVDNVERLYKHLDLLSELLGFLGFPFQRVDILDILRHLNEYRASGTTICDDVLYTTAQLAFENARLGKTGRASHLYAQALSWYTHKHCEDPVSEKAKILYLLRYARSLACHGSLEKSFSLYHEALEMSLGLDPDESTTTGGRIRARIVVVERAALASSVYAAIKDGEDDTVAMLVALEQSLRLWNRALENVTRLSPSVLQPAVATEDANPFTDDETTVNKNKSRVSKRSPVSSDGLQWRIAEGLLETLLSLAKAHCRQGSPRAALLYFQRAAEVADGLNAPIMLGNTLALQAELRLMSEDSVTEDDLAQATNLLGDLRGAEMVEILRIRGDRFVKLENREQAREVYTSASGVLQDLESTYARVIATQHTPLKLSRRRTEVKSSEIKSSLSDAALDALLPALQAALLRQQVWLLKDPSDSHEFEELLIRLLSLPPLGDLKAEENALLGQVHLHDACNQFRNDLFLSSLTESIIAIPMGMASGHSIVSSASSTQAIETLHKADQYFAEALELMLRKGHVSQLRKVSVSLALIRAFQTTLGKVSVNGPRLAASLLEMCSGSSLHRQMLESIDLKHRQGKPLDDLIWPATPAQPNVGRRQRNVRDPDTLEEDGESSDEDDPSSDASYWDATRKRYNALLSDLSIEAPAQVDQLPPNWTVVSINVTEDRSTMLIARHRSLHEPLVLCLPLDRQGKREGEDDQFTFQHALDELDDIIQSSNQGILAAKEVAGKDATASWWSERGELDRRLGELLETMEFCWLGAFKTVMCEYSRASKNSLKALRTRLEKIFQGVVGSADKNPASWTRLDDNILECFACLSPKCRDEELEDLIYFVLDLYHFHGVPVALAEIDVDVVVTDIRIALEEFASWSQLAKSGQGQDHLFLVLDKNVQGIPWESMPILKGRSVSRIPSISFLVDRIELTRHRRAAKCPLGSTADPIDRADVDPRRTYYMLNVSGDLTKTEQQFAPWLKEMDQIGWRGIAGRAPMEGEMLLALESSDLVLYFGHGGGEQYVRSQQIRGLSRCAAVMLWGCSSGALREMGEFDRFGTPHNYMLAGCPNVVATLWDVTDRDIDKFSESVFKKLRLDRKSVESWTSTRSSSTSIVAAVAQSRDVCKLKYLNGAAPVVYGIPYYL